MITSTSDRFNLFWLIWLALVAVAATVYGAIVFVTAWQGHPLAPLVPITIGYLGVIGGLVLTARLVAARRRS